MTRARKSEKPGLTKARIVEACLAILDRDGADGLSMRKLAQALNVEAMSLYNHVQDKQELLQEAVALVLSRVPIPPASDPWRKRVEALIFGLYQTLVAHPYALALLVREDVRIPDAQALALMDAVAKALAEAGMPPADQVNAYRGLISLCFGFVLAHTRGFTSTRAQAEDIWDRWDPETYVRSGFPSLAKLAPQFLKTRAGDDLKFMLSVYLDALEAKAR
jgi:TetR/AcrR family transcriptional regulator, tetracycline repressor protein